VILLILCFFVQLLKAEHDHAMDIIPLGFSSMVDLIGILIAMHDRICHLYRPLVSAIDNSSTGCGGFCDICLLFFLFTTAQEAHRYKGSGYNTSCYSHKYTAETHSSLVDGRKAVTPLVNNFSFFNIKSFIHIVKFYQLCIMKLTLKIKLLPTKDQPALLLQTMKVTNAACDSISEVAWQEKIFNKVKLHSQVYYPLRSTFELSSQMLIRSIAKVCDAYALDKKTKRKFNPLGAIAYDARIMTYKPNNVVSLWCLGGRQKIDFVCHKPEHFSLKKGEADLVYKKGKFFLCQTIEVPPEETKSVDDFIGCDFGITDIVVTSDGVKHPADGLNTYREHR